MIAIHDLYNMNIENSRILITGASKGLGRATAEALSAKGAQLILNVMSVSKMKSIYYCLLGYP